MSSQLAPATIYDEPQAEDSALPVGELSRRLAAELAAAAEICRACEILAGDLAEHGAPLENLSKLQALDELTQRLSSLSGVLAKMGEAAEDDWSLALEPLLGGVGLADLVVRLRARDDHQAWDAQAGELDFF